jgi:PD-(D/E)XK endonuclease
MGTRTYTDDALVAAVAGARSWRDVLRRLGLTGTSSAAIRSVQRHAGRLGLDSSHFTGQRRWTETDLARAVAGSTSWSQVTIRLGLAGGSTRSLLKGHALRMGLDSSHFGTADVKAPARAEITPDLSNLPRAGSLMAATWLTLCGFEISWPLEPVRYDLVALRDGSLRRIQVKTCRRWHAGGWMVSLATTSGHLRTYDPDDIDDFFVVDGDLEFYLIPVAAVAGRYAITLSRYQAFRMEQVPVEIG